MKIHLGTVVLIASLLLSPAVWAGGATPCPDSLQAADQALQRPDDARDQELYQTAFQVCAGAGELPLALEARLADRKAHYQVAYEDDHAAGIQILELALERVDVRGGMDHPARVELLESLASAISEQESVRRGLKPGESPRVVALAEESLLLRERLYGDESKDAAEGHVLLAGVFLSTDPARAELEARRAFEIGKALLGPNSEVVLEALATLGGAQREQGKMEEARATQDMVSEVLEAQRSQVGQH